MISVFSNTLGREELEAIPAIFQSRWVGIGEQCKAFEKEFADHLAVRDVLLTNSCTSAMYVGLRALGIKPGDEVIVSTVNFLTVASAIIDLGAKPVFADVDPRTLNILPSEIKRLITDRTKAVFLVHYGGHPCPMDEIRAACRKGISIIEDSAIALSSLYKGKPCGAIGDMAVFSFGPVKSLCMVEGGALYLHDKEAMERARSYANMGLAPEATSGMSAMGEGKRRWWEYDLMATSGKFTGNDVFAAMGRAQLKKLPAFTARRKELWERYQWGFRQLMEVNLPPEPLPHTTSSYFFYWLRIARGRDELAHHLLENGVYTTFRYYPLHLVRYFYDVNCVLANAEAASETVLNLPLHQNLTDDDIDKIVALTKKFVRRWK